VHLVPNMRTGRVTPGEARQRFTKRMLTMPSLPRADAEPRVKSDPSLSHGTSSHYSGDMLTHSPVVSSTDVPIAPTPPPITGRLTASEPSVDVAVTPLVMPLPPTDAASATLDAIALLPLPLVSVGVDETIGVDADRPPAISVGAESERSMAGARSFKSHNLITVLSSRDSVCR
jgi:hypothetical protein